MLVNNESSEVGAISLSVAGAPNSILRDDPAIVQQILKGLATQTAQENDVYMIDELRNTHFGMPGTGGTDLAAVDIQRGRDLGLINRYNRLRIDYNLPPLSLFSQLTSDATVQGALTNVYGIVDNVDAWVAMIAENHVPGSSLGKLSEQIILSQFERLRDGDRFFYTGDVDLQSDLVTSVIDLNTISLSQIIKLNTEVTNLQENVFFAASTVPEPSTCSLLVAGVCMTWLLALRGNSPPIAGNSNCLSLSPIKQL
jgi:hypothetical protein